MQDLERPFDALLAAGIEPKHIYPVKKSGFTVDRPGLAGVLRFGCDGDAIVVHTLDRLGRTLRDTLNMIHDVAGREGLFSTHAHVSTSSPALHRARQGSPAAR